MRLFVVLSAVAPALAQFLTVQTPSGVVACQPTLITWTGGTPPYTVSILPGGQPSANALETFPNQPSGSYQWLVIEPPGSSLFIRVRDNFGQISETASFTVQNSGATCDASSSTTSASTSTSTSSANTISTASENTSPFSSSTTTSATTSTGGASSLQVTGGLFTLVGAVAVALA